MKFKNPIGLTSALGPTRGRSRPNSEPRPGHWRVKWPSAPGAFCRKPSLKLAEKLLQVARFRLPRGPRHPNEPPKPSQTAGGLKRQEGGRLNPAAQAALTPEQASQSAAPGGSMAGWGKKLSCSMLRPARQQRETENLLEVVADSGGMPLPAPSPWPAPAGCHAQSKGWSPIGAMPVQPADDFAIAIRRIGERGLPAQAPGQALTTRLPGTPISRAAQLIPLLRLHR